MARKTLRNPDQTADPRLLKAGVERALHEGLHRDALEQARTLHEIAPHPDHRELLVRATFETSEQMLAGPQASQAVTVASKIWMLVSGPAEKERLADIMARAGNLAKAWTLAEEVGEPALTARILGHAADNAVRNLPTLTGGIPADFMAHKDAVQRAFAEAAAGNDEQARAALQIIGLTSPFLEWKLLLRGLLAYYQNEDAKAVENWQRLNPKRVPARLAAPFLAVVDPAFRAGQSPESRTRLQDCIDRLQGSGLVAPLRSLQKHLAKDKPLAQSFRTFQPILPALRAEAPQLVQRVAGCFFWAIVDHGRPNDLQHYLAVFGPPRHDPELSRLEALALEDRHDLEQAHAAWRDFEQSLAEFEAELPAGHADCMRSLVWLRMADNAAKLPDEEIYRRSRRMPFGMLGGLPRPLKPNAETCLKKSIELTPGLLDSHRLLVAIYLEAGKNSKALTAVKKMLKTFPDRAQALEVAGNLSLECEKFVDAVKYFTKALQVNPIDSKLRQKLGDAHAACAEYSAARFEFDKARQEFGKALALREGVGRLAVLVSWAACEFRARDHKRAEDLLAQARAGEGFALAVAYAMLSYAIHLKLPKDLKKLYENEFNQRVKDEPDAASAVAIAVLLALLHRAGIQFSGRKTHEKKAQAYMERAKGVASETQLQQICEALLDMSAGKLVTAYFTHGQCLFPRNPYFYLAEIDAEFLKPPHEASSVRVSRVLGSIREIAGTLPQRERDAVLTQAEERQTKLDAMGPGNLFGDRSDMESFFEDVFGRLADQFDNDDSDFDDDDM